MLTLLLVFAALAIVARVFYVAGYATASRRAREIARLYSVEAARADVPVGHGDAGVDDTPDLAEYFGGPVGDEPERLQAKLRVIECSVCGEPGCPDHM